MTLKEGSFWLLVVLIFCLGEVALIKGCYARPQPIVETPAP